MSERIEVERIGGLAGFGPGSRIRSRGSVATASLSHDERGAVDALFSKRAGATRPQPDAFRYRVTRGTTTVEVDEAHVPPALRDCVKDELV